MAGHAWRTSPAQIAWKRLSGLLMWNLRITWGQWAGFRRQPAASSPEGLRWRPPPPSDATYIRRGQFRLAAVGLAESDALTTALSMSDAERGELFPNAPTGAQAPSRMTGGLS